MKRHLFASHVVCRFVSAVSSVLVLSNTVDAQQAKVSTFTGPMVGHVAPTEANIWAHHEPERDLVVWYRGPDAKLVTVNMTTRPEEHHASRARLTGLHPATAYTYGVMIDGVSHPQWQGRFTTPPKTGSPARFRIALSSCMHAGKFPVQSSWYLLLAEQPAFHLLLGDNVYADTTDRETLWARHLEQRGIREFAAVLRNVPTYAMWDDHDYGPNNSDGTEPGKAESLRAFRELFANPGAGTEDTPGAFYRFSWGDVDFFVLDGRYHRSPDNAPNDERKRMLGDEQFTWLVEGLKASRARFKVLASGSTLMTSRTDGWRIYDFARKRLYHAIMANKIGGVLYLSGDIHKCILETHATTETGGYPLYEVISSGIANSPTRGFATLDFDTTLADPTVRVRILHGDATVQLDRTLRLSELQVR